MTSKVIQGHWKLHESIGHMALPCAVTTSLFAPLLRYYHFYSVRYSL